MKRVLIISLSILLIFAMPALAQSMTYTVQPGDSMWKIAVRYEMGLSELAQANPQIKNLALIYPGQKIAISNIDSVKALEIDPYYPPSWGFRYNLYFSKNSKSKIFEDLFWSESGTEISGVYSLGYTFFI
jgi:spore coat assembly protein SafA